MAECSMFEDAAQLIADEYWNNRQISPEPEDSMNIDDGSDHHTDITNEEELFTQSPTQVGSGIMVIDHADTVSREIDVDEMKSVREFITKTCKCTKKNGGPCSTYFSFEQLTDHRMQMAELDNESLDLVILGQINAHHFTDDLAGHHSQAADRKKGYMAFYYHSHPIYLVTFLFIILFGIGKKRFRNLLQHYKLNGLSPRVHGNYKHKPWNAAKLQDKEWTIRFIKNYAEIHALPLPGRMPHFNDYNIMLLPSDTTKALVHRYYVSSIADAELQQSVNSPAIRCFGYREFCRLWSEVIPYIRVMPPAEDICNICQVNATRICRPLITLKKKLYLWLKNTFNTQNCNETTTGSR